MAAAGLEHAQDVADRIVANVERVVLGKTEQIRFVLAALACRGHVLLEDVPGTAKTVLARSLTQSIEGAVHARIQCTPDLQPTDVTGLSIYDQRTREFVFRPGPVFANVVLVDEINRAMPKTQSALLEAMAERQVTVDGETRALPDPFLVMATENPLEYEGTFPLPEAQLDRFFLRTSLGYPGTDNELRILRDQRRGHPLERLEPAVTLEDLRALQEAVAEIYMDELVELWIVRLVESTRTLEELAVERPSAARSPSPKPRARGRCSTAESMSSPPTSRSCSCRCSGTACSSSRPCWRSRMSSAARTCSTASATAASHWRHRRTPPRSARSRPHQHRPRPAERMRTRVRAVFPLVSRRRLVGVPVRRAPDAAPGPRQRRRRVEALRAR